MIYMKKTNTPHIIPVPYNKPIEICADNETLPVLQRFRALRVANYELTQTWCIVPESENPIRLNSLTAYLNLQTGELTINSNPGVSFMVNGLALNGGITIVHCGNGDYFIHIIDLAHGSSTAIPTTKEEDLIATLDHVINGDATRAERIAHLATIDPAMAEAILAGKRVLIL